MDQYHDVQRDVSDLDIALYDEETHHLHYIELKQNRENRREWKARNEQIPKATRFFFDLGIDVSASEIYYEEDHQNIVYHPEDCLRQSFIPSSLLERYEASQRDRAEDPLERLENHSIIRHHEDDQDADDSLVQIDDEEESLLDIDYPLNHLARQLKTLSDPVEQDLKARFGEVPDRQDIHVVYVCHPEKAPAPEIPPCAIEQLPDNCKAEVPYRPEYEEDETARPKRVLIHARQPVEELFNVELKGGD